MDDYIWAVTSLHFSRRNIPFRLALCTLDPVKDYLPSSSALILDLNGFQLSFEGSEEILRYLKLESYIEFYMNFFKSTSGVKETISKENKVKSSGVCFLFLMENIITKKEDTLKVYYF